MFVSQDVIIRMRGQSRPPDDLVNAARQSLDAEGFEELMRETDGVPTADQLVAKVNARRAAA